jgi:AcrR family transcriptional regulator
MQPSTRAAGRPRRQGLDEAILNAALTELARVGYTRMTIAAVAERAGTTKPSVYMRFPTKADLAARALESLRRRTPRALTGDARADLIEELSLLRSGALERNGITMLASVLAEEHVHPELLALFREHVIEPRRRNLRRILQTAVADGQVDADADIELAIAMLVGSLYAAYSAGSRPGIDWPQRVVDAWLRSNAPRTPKRPDDDGGGPGC